MPSNTNEPGSKRNGANPSKPTTKRPREDRWGKDVIDAAGFMVIPTLLLHAQARLGLTPVQLVVVLQLLSHWHTSEPPRPHKKLLADRMSLSDRQLQRIIAELEKAGLLARIERKGRHGIQANYYDLSGLVEKLRSIAPDFIEVKKQRESVEKRGARISRAPSGS